MKVEVYVVIHEVPYEGGSVVGVYGDKSQIPDQYTKAKIRMSGYYEIEPYEVEIPDKKEPSND